jgi:hypothetical protein
MIMNPPHTYRYVSSVSIAICDGTVPENKFPDNFKKVTADNALKLGNTSPPI